MSYHKLRTRGTLIAVLAIIIKDLIAGTRPHDITSLDDVTGMVGLALIVLGTVVRSWATGIRTRDALATTGPYSLMRHPLYCASLVIAVGLCIVIGSVVNFLIVAMVIVPLHVGEVVREEKLMADRFDDRWRTFARRTGMFYPKTVPVGLFTGWSLAVWLRSREYTTLIAIIAGVILLKLWYEFPDLLTSTAAAAAG